ncbi:hypothetical protein Q5P01_013139 [Channa striata]|uniref:Fibronectin type-III domain-containing protein n=1 Tax=Channa striata TaxID=64152 RepID=A0AA88SK12_CHASR|nr:hypothetical protein Q5P01_013139 [Channa striata]
MKCLPLLYLIPLLHHGLGSLHAPVNVSVQSHNYHHVLQWDSSPGTPSGTLYKIYNSRVNKMNLLLLNSTTGKSVELRIDLFKKCHLLVVASYNGTESPESNAVTFTPYKDTNIGPPEVSLDGCGNCIRINISLPKHNNRAEAEGLYNDPQFEIFWRKKHEKNPQSIFTRNMNFTLDNLEKGVEYCVMVDIHIRTNKNTLKSDWKCIFTSIVESHSDAAVLGPFAALLILLIGFLMISIFFLYYTGYFCEGPTTLPNALVVDQPVKLQTKVNQTGDKEMIHYQMFLCHSYTLMPEKTYPGLISVSLMQNHRMHHNPTSPHQQDGYMDRNTRKVSFNGLGISKLAVSEDSGSLTERFSTKMEVPSADKVVHTAPKQDEPEAERETVSFLSEEDQTGVQGYFISEEESMEVCESSENVNLLSVTIAALNVGKKEDPTLLPLTVSSALSSTDYQMESDSETAVPSMQPTQEYTESLYEERHADTQSSEEEEEEERSDYMAHI